MKRYIAAILVPCFLIQLSGCYSMQEISRDEFAQRSGQEDLQIETNEGKILSFNKDNYIVRSDSIIGVGNTVSYYDWIPETEFEGSIAIDEIESFSMESFSLFNTIGAVLGGFFIGIIVFGAISGFEYNYKGL